MLSAKKTFSTIASPEDLQNILLRGSTFSGIASIEENGLHEFFNLLSRYGSDKSFVFSVKNPRKKRAAVNPEVASLKKEKEKLERAMRRLQDLYLYSEQSISEKDFIIRKSEITSHLKEINVKLGVMNSEPDAILSDEDFIKQASHLLIQKELKDKKYIYYKDLASSVDPEILKTYMRTILDTVYVEDGKVTSITFKK